MLLSFGGDLGSFRAFVGLKGLNWTIVGTVLLTRSGKLYFFRSLLVWYKFGKFAIYLKIKKNRKFMLGIVAFYSDLDLKLDKFVFFFFLMNLMIRPVIFVIGFSPLLLFFSFVI